MFGPQNADTFLNSAVQECTPVTSQLCTAARPKACGWKPGAIARSSFSVTKRPKKLRHAAMHPALLTTTMTTALAWGGTDQFDQISNICTAVLVNGSLPAAETQ